MKSALVFCSKLRYIIKDPCTLNIKMTDRVTASEESEGWSGSKQVAEGMVMKMRSEKTIM